MKHGATVAALAMLAFLLAVPVAIAQPEPPGGWYNWQMQNVTDFNREQFIALDENMCEGDIIGKPDRWSQWCGRLEQRYRSGQINRIEMRKIMNDFYVGQARMNYGGYGSNWFGQHTFGFGRTGGQFHGGFGGPYVWDGGYWRGMARTARELRDPLLAGVAANLGLGVVDRILDKKEHADEEKTKRQEMMYKYGTHPDQQKAEQESVPTRASAPATIPDPTRGGTQRVSLINASGCVVSIREANGREAVIAPNESLLISQFEGLAAMIESGNCTEGIHIKRFDENRQGLLRCGPPLEES